MEAGAPVLDDFRLVAWWRYLVGCCPCVRSTSRRPGLVRGLYPEGRALVAQRIAGASVLPGDTMRRRLATLEVEPNHTAR